MQVEETITLNVPPLTLDQDILEVEQEGHCSEYIDGYSGNLLVKVSTKYNHFHKLVSITLFQYL